MTAIKVKTTSGWITLNGGPPGAPGAPAYPTPVVNGQWIKGVGGAAVWQPIAQADLPSNLQAQEQPIPVGNDFNNAQNTGWYRADPGAANAPPVNAYYHVFVLNMFGNQLRQTAYQIGTDVIYTRRNDTGTWTAWVALYPAATTLLRSGDFNGSTLDITGIPQTHNGLLFQATAGCPAGDGTVSMGLRVNGYAGNDYMWQFVQGAGTGVSAADQGGARDVNAFIGYLNGNWTYGAFEMVIPDYRNAWATGGYCRNQYMLSTGVGGLPTVHSSWNVTNHGGSQQITRLTFITRTGSGSFSLQNWRLYGLA